MNIDVVEAELTNAEKVLSKYDNNITIFGSARVLDTNPLAQEAFRLGKLLSDNGFNVLTGAGPGIMQSANKGAFAGRAKSIGFNINLPKEQAANSYLDECLMFEHFFTRKVMLIKHANACVFFPGGFGTVDELMEVLTLIQTKKGKNIKVFLFDSKFWSPLIKWLEKSLLKNGYISKNNLNSFCLVDDIRQILQQLKAE